MDNSRRSIRRATRKNLAALNANFSIDGLRFHYQSLNRYTNPTGGGLDKIPMNTKAYTAAYYRQFDEVPPNTPSPGLTDPWDALERPQKRFHLSKKAMYQVADHLLGIAKKAFWTGSTRKMTLLGLDIDDHCSPQHEVQRNSMIALQLFEEMTGLKPVCCQSPRGINAYLICHRWHLDVQESNQTWHSIVRAVNNEANNRGLIAKLECKGQARIFDGATEYCGVLFKDPFWGQNPTDEEIYSFWNQMEGQPVTGSMLRYLKNRFLHKSELRPVVNDLEKMSSPVESRKGELLLENYRKKWAKQCREWAIHGLPADDSMQQVVAELSKWLYFIEFVNFPESVRSSKVADTLIHFILTKHNGYVTRLNQGKVDDVVSHISRIVDSIIHGTSEKAKTVFSQITQRQYAHRWELTPLILEIADNTSFSSLSSVKFIQCCSLLNDPWLPKDEYWRTRAEKWNYEPDETPLPQKLEARIRRFYARRNLRINKPSFANLAKFVNYLRVNNGEARLGVLALKRMGFSKHSTRLHVKRLAEMGLISITGYCPSYALSRSYRLQPECLQYYPESNQCVTESIEAS